MFNDTVTVYSKYTQDNRERWKRTVVPCVNWTDGRGAAIRKTGIAPEDSVTLIIPQAALAGFVKPKAFAALPDKSGAWTLTPATDIVVLGAVAVEITTSPGKDLAALDDVRTVTGVDYNLHGGLAHLDVRGK